MPRHIQLLPGEQITLADGTVVSAVLPYPTPSQDAPHSQIEIVRMNLSTYVDEERGRQTALGAAVKAHPQTVWQWARGARRVPRGKCAAVEAASKGAVTVEELRPDLPWARIPDSSWPHPEGRPVVHEARAVVGTPNA